MKNKIYYILGLILFSFTFSSCDLQKDPLDEFSEDTFFDSPLNLDLALTSLYRGNISNGVEYAPSDWWSYHGLIMMEHISDNAFDRRGELNPLFRISNGTLDATNSVINNYWKASYTRIGYCNRFLEGMDSQPVNEENSHKIAEARFIRATMYFYLASYFHDVPLVTKVLTGEEANNVDKASRSEILDWIVVELKSAADNLMSFGSIGASDKGRATKQAALAFLGRTYLLMGDWDNGSAIYKEIIDLNENELHNNYSELFLPATGGSTKENIFSIHYMQDYFGTGLPQHGLSAKDGGWSLINPASGLFESYEMIDGELFSYDNSNFDYNNPGKNRDPRLDYTIYYNGAIFMGTEYKISPDFVGKENLGYKEEASRTGYMMRKYFDESGIDNIRSYGGITPIIRYAEVLLSYAECVNEQGKMSQQVMDATVNKIRSRQNVNMPAKVSRNQETNRQTIRNERRVELAMEGIRYWDLMRWNIAHENLSQDIWGAQCIGSTTYANTTKKIDPTGNMRWYVGTRQFRKEIDYKWPIPQAEQNINPNLRD